MVRVCLVVIGGLDCYLLTDNDCLLAGSVVYVYRCCCFGILALTFD